jgi:hypothetical protein
MTRLLENVDITGIEPAPERGKHTQWSTFLKAPGKCYWLQTF